MTINQVNDQISNNAIGPIETAIQRQSSGGNQMNNEKGGQNTNLGVIPEEY